MNTAQPAGGASAREGRSGPDPLRIWVSDPWCRTPWYTAELVRALAATQNKVRMVCPSYRLEPEFMRAEGLRPQPGLVDLAARMDKAPAWLSGPARVLEYGINSAALASLAMVRAPEVVHQQQCVLLERGWTAEVALLRWLRARGAALVHTVHNLLPHGELNFHHERFQLLYRECDALICHDHKTAEQLRREFEIPRERIHTIPHGPLFARPPARTTEACREELGIAPTVPVYLALGVIAPYKGLDILLEAWANLMRAETEGPRPLLLIAGTGKEPLLDQLRSRAAEFGSNADSVRMDLRYIEAAEIPIYMQAAEVLLYPYRAITTSGALLTGLNYRKPIIATDLPALRQYLTDGGNALLVAPEDREALVAALRQSRDLEKLRTLKAGSQGNPLLHVQWEQIAERTVAVYRQAIDRRHSLHSGAHVCTSSAHLVSGPAVEPSKSSTYGCQSDSTLEPELHIPRRI